MKCRISIFSEINIKISFKSQNGRHGRNNKYIHRMIIFRICLCTELSGCPLSIAYLNYTCSTVDSSNVLLYVLEISFKRKLLDSVLLAGIASQHFMIDHKFSYLPRIHQTDAVLDISKLSEGSSFTFSGYYMIVSTFYESFLQYLLLIQTRR